jgi:hypothetical protein
MPVVIFDWEIYSRPTNEAVFIEHVKFSLSDLGFSLILAGIFQAGFRG